MHTRYGAVCKSERGEAAEWAVAQTAQPRESERAERDRLRLSGAASPTANSDISHLVGVTGGVRALPAAAVATTARAFSPGTGRSAWPTGPVAENTEPRCPA